MAGYQVKYEKKAAKQIEKLDGTARVMIRAWIEKNLVGTTNPRIHGKALKGELGEYWRYRIGDYRIIAEINDKEVLIRGWTEKNLVEPHVFAKKTTSI